MDIDNGRSHILKAGSLLLNYRDGSLRYIKTGNTELVRMIYFALRDPDWLNADFTITDEIIDKGSQSFSISFKSRYTRGKIDFESHTRIVGSSDNAIEYTFEGKALASFHLNRIGLCLHHPVKECSGKPCTIIHSDGSQEITSFPALIDPHQPFTDIRSMLWRSGDTECQANFRGEIFETEDQRNWTDSSFKTYSTPLSLPRPVLINKGEKISQTIRLKVKMAAFIPPDESDPVVLSCSLEEIADIPRIGIGRSTRINPLTENEISVLKKLPFSHYRTELYLFRSGWEDIARSAVVEADMLGYSLELALFFGEDHSGECDRLIEFFSVQRIQVSVIAVYHNAYPATPDQLSLAVIDRLRKAFPGAGIAAGTNANFAQLNRNRPKISGPDLVCFSIQPQEHASDDQTLVENISAQGDAVITARSFAGDAGIWVSPVTIKRRFNANIRFCEDTAKDDEHRFSIDRRMMDSFGMCWTAGSFKHLSLSGVSGITYYETVGERGIMQGDYPTEYPQIFPSEAGEVFPVCNLFMFLLENKDLKVAQSFSSSPLNADALVLTDNKIFKAVIINYRPEITRVKLSFGSGYKAIPLKKITGGKIASKSELNTRPENLNIKDGVLQLNPFSLIFIEGRF